MSAPRGLTGCALAFWGWQVDMLPAGIALGALIELRQFVAFRLDLDVVDTRRLTRFSAVLLAATAASAYLFGPGGLGSTLQMLRWLPLPLFPLVLAQSFSTSGGIDARALLGWDRGPGPIPGIKTVLDLNFGFVVVCLIASGAANQRTFWFYAGLVVLTAIALWRIRPANARPVLWAAALVLAAGLGHVGHIGLAQLQDVVIEKTVEWLSGEGGATDPYKRTTALGYIGDLKFSDSIVLRVTADEDRPPLYLHRATYDGFSNGTWLARRAPLKPLAAGGPDEWTVLERKGEGRVHVSGRITGGKGILALPAGVTRIENLSAVSVARNHLGSTEAKRESESYRLSATYVQDETAESVPTEWDTGVPKAEQPTLRDLVRNLGIGDASARARVEAVRAFFARGFEYALYQPERKIDGTAISDFLTKSRSGHCEYYASATVLLLREAGVPARYATGFSVQEWSELERAWVVRLRHAHAWVRAWVDGRWVDVDTTPASWVNVENEQASFFEPLLDRWSWLVHRLRAWRTQRAGKSVSPWWGILLATPVFWLLWRRRSRLTRARAGTSDDVHAADAQGKDSDFYRIVKMLAARGIVRGTAEPASGWLARVRACEPEDSYHLIAELDALHQRHRFDPVGLDPDNLRRLANGVASWLESYNYKGGGNK